VLGVFQILISPLKLYAAHLVTDELERLGASLFLKPVGTPALVSFIERGLAGNALERQCRRFRLTDRERQLVRWTAASRQRKAFGAFAGISEATVRTYARSICKKTGSPSVRAFVEATQEPWACAGRREARRDEAS
jgi:DNA-binding CsgD family transcriptional regulator